MASSAAPQDPTVEDKGKGKAPAEDVPQDDAMGDDDEDDSSSDEDEEVSKNTAESCYFTVEQELTRARHQPTGGETRQDTRHVPVRAFREV